MCKYICNLYLYVIHANLWWPYAYHLIKKVKLYFQRRTLCSDDFIHFI